MTNLLDTAATTATSADPTTTVHVNSDGVIVGSTDMSKKQGKKKSGDVVAACLALYKSILSAEKNRTERFRRFFISLEPATATGDARPINALVHLLNSSNSADYRVGRKYAMHCCPALKSRKGKLVWLPKDRERQTFILANDWLAKDWNVDPDAVVPQHSETTMAALEDARDEALKKAAAMLLRSAKTFYATLKPTDQTNDNIRTIEKSYGLKADSLADALAKAK